MTRVQSPSSRAPGEQAALPVVIPTPLSPEIQAAAVRLMTRAEAMGLIAHDDLLTLSTSTLSAALHAFHAAGIGRLLVSAAEVDQDPRGALNLMNEAVEQSPHPSTEWAALSRVLGPDLLGRLVGKSPSSLRRYSTGERETPIEPAVRLHWLAMRIADLAGAYNQFGIQRWFDRPRTALADQSPADRLVGDWVPEDPQVAEVAELAATLVAMAAA